MTKALEYHSMFFVLSIVNIKISQHITATVILTETLESNGQLLPSSKTKL